MFKSQSQVLARLRALVLSVSIGFSLGIACAFHLISKIALFFKSSFFWIYSLFPIESLEFLMYSAN